MKLPDFLTENADSDIRVTGHRIGLLHLVHYYNEGYSAEMLVCQYPTLSMALVHKVIAFYWENQKEVDAYVAACKAEMDEQFKANPNRVNIAQLRERMHALQQAQAVTQTEQS